MNWDDIFSHRERGRIKPLVPQIREALQQSITGNDFKWLIEALHAEDKQQWVARVFQWVQPVPEPLFEPMLRTAVYENNPSLNRLWIEPCLATFGIRRVNERLLKYLEEGTDFEKAGAVNALYWAQGGSGTHLEILTDHCITRETIDAVLPRLRAEVQSMPDLWQRKREMLLREFVSNPHVDVRRSIIPGLTLNKEKYPENLHPLVDEAIQIARGHTDDYIRHRVEVQLGNEKLFAALPHRKSDSEQSDEDI